MEDKDKKGNGGKDGKQKLAKIPHLLTIREVAELLAVTERHIRRLVHERRIPYVKWGHLIRFDPDEIAAWLDRARRPDEGNGAAGQAS